MSKKQFDFIGKRKLFLLISVAILVAGLIANLFLGTQLDITFKGGAIFTGVNELSGQEETIVCYYTKRQ